jgi:3D (Asp-Asp-Asp) domain-containing protein
MTFHISSKLFAIVLVVAALITAFRAPANPVDISVIPGLVLAKSVNVRLSPQVNVAAKVEIPTPKVKLEQIPELVEVEMPVPQLELMPVEAVQVEPVQVEPVQVEPVQAEPVLETQVLSVPRYTLKSTAYNSHASQTDSTPDVTATGATTTFGVIAVSRDLLDSSIPYGSLVRLKDLGSYRSGRGEGKFQDVLDSQGLFIVEDTMHPRKIEQIDVWFADESEALSWGVRKVELEVVRVGRDGPMLGATVLAAQ